MPTAEGISIAGIVGILVIVFGVIIPIIIGVLVYFDARRRQMSAFTWALVAALVPGLIGVIIYFIAAVNKKPSVRCPVCGKPIKDSYNRCPFCAALLKDAVSEEV